MRGMILAAGRGSRLKEQTMERPKPLVPIDDQHCLIDLTVQKFIQAGIVEIAVNLHYLGEMIQEHLESKWPGVQWAFFYEDPLLNTGGGIKNACSFLEESEHCLISNSDIFHFFDFNSVIASHIQSGNRATMVLRKKESSKRAVLYGPKRGVLGFTSPDGKLYYHQPVPAEPCFQAVFTGVQVFHRSIFQLMDGGIFSIIDVYDKMIKNGDRIHFMDVHPAFWSDLGTPAALTRGRELFSFYQNGQALIHGSIHHAETLFKGASGKEVVALRSKEKSAVCIGFSSEEEKENFETLTSFLLHEKIAVPKIISSKGLSLLVEDGGMPLLHYIQEGDSRVADFYEKCVLLLKGMQNASLPEFLDLNISNKKYFDLDNIIFDLNYFNREVFNKTVKEVQSFFPAWSKDVKGEWSRADIEKTAEIILSVLSQHPASLMHRDFQCSNLLVDSEGEIRLIDLGTCRKGFVIYDLASLLFDFNVEHDEVRFQHLLEVFFNEFPELKRDVFWAAGWIRLIQALATAFRFGPERPFFAAKIPKGFKKLRRVYEEPSAQPFLNKLPDDLNRSIVNLLSQV